LLCRPCYTEISMEVKRLHAEGKPVNVPEIAASRAGKPFRVKFEDHATAELRAAEICKATGKPVTWTDVIHAAITKYLK